MKSHKISDSELKRIYANNKVFRFEKHDFVQIPKFILAEKSLSCYEHVVYAILLSHIYRTKSSTGMCCPMTKTIASECSISISKVDESLNILRREGWIDWKIVGRSRTYAFFNPEQRSKRKESLAKNEELTLLHWSVLTTPLGKRRYSISEDIEEYYSNGVTNKSNIQQEE